MNKKINHLLLALLLPAVSLAAHEGHDHDHGGHGHAEKKAGPNGGRLFEAFEGDAEFLLAEGRTVEIRFFEEDGETIAPGDRKVTVIGGDRSNPIRLAFAIEDGVLVSTEPIPEGKNLPMIVTIRHDGETVRERFTLNTSDCPTCDYLEYACTCTH